MWTDIRSSTCQFLDSGNSGLIFKLRILSVSCRRSTDRARIDNNSFTQVSEEGPRLAEPANLSSLLGSSIIPTTSRLSNCTPFNSNIIRPVTWQTDLTYFKSEPVHSQNMSNLLPFDIHLPNCLQVQ